MHVNQWTALLCVLIFFCVHGGPGCRDVPQQQVQQVAGPAQPQQVPPGLPAPATSPKQTPRPPVGSPQATARPPRAARAACRRTPAQSANTAPVADVLPSNFVRYDQA